MIWQTLGPYILNHIMTDWNVTLNYRPVLWSPQGRSKVKITFLEEQLGENAAPRPRTTHASCTGRERSTATWPSARTPLTAGLDLPHVVARKPAGPAIVRALPPAALLDPRDVDDVALRKGELILIGLLEVKLRSHYQLAAASISHVLKGKRGEKCQAVCIIRKSDVSLGYLEQAAPFQQQSTFYGRETGFWPPDPPDHHHLISVLSQRKPL